MSYLSLTLFLEEHFHGSQEVEEIYARPDAASGAAPAVINQQERRKEESQQPQTSHYASVRARLEDAVSEVSDRATTGETGQDETGILSNPFKFQELADVMYFWALAEAYLQHPQMQQDMRQALLLRLAAFSFC